MQGKASPLMAKKVEDPPAAQLKAFRTIRALSFSSKASAPVNFMDLVKDFNEGLGRFFLEHHTIFSHSAWLFFANAQECILEVKNDCRKQKGCISLGRTHGTMI